MRLAPALAAAVTLAILAAASAQANQAFSGGLKTASEKTPGRSGPAYPIIGSPEPSGHAITGSDWQLAPSEQLTGQQAALRFRFQQQMQNGDRPWLGRMPQD